MTNSNSTGFKVGRRIGNVIGSCLKYGFVPLMILLGLKKRRPITEGYKPKPKK